MLGHTLCMKTDTPAHKTVQFEDVPLKSLKTD